MAPFTLLLLFCGLPFLACGDLDVAVRLLGISGAETSESLADQLISSFQDTSFRTLASFPVSNVALSTDPPPVLIPNTHTHTSCSVPLYPDHLVCARVRAGLGDAGRL